MNPDQEQEHINQRTGTKLGSPFISTITIGDLAKHKNMDTVYHLLVGLECALCFYCIVLQRLILMMISLLPNPIAQYLCIHAESYLTSTKD